MTTLYDLPNVILYIIAEFASEHILNDNINEYNIACSGDSILNNTSPGVHKFLCDRNISLKLLSIDRVVWYYIRQSGYRDIFDKFLEIIDKYRYHFTYDDNVLMSSINNDNMVSYMINYNSENIDYGLFSTMDNDIAVNHCLENIDAIYWNGFNRNPNDIAVRYLINYPRYIIANSFSKNTNTLAIEFIISQRPELICMKSFVKNTNPLAVQYCITHIGEIRHIDICDNRGLIEHILDNNLLDKFHLLSSAYEHDRYIEYIIGCIEMYDILPNPDNINWYKLCTSNNDMAIKYLINNPEHIRWCMFFRNTSDLAAEFIVDNYDRIKNMTCEDCMGCGNAYNVDNIKILSSNKNPIIIDFLIDNPDEMDPFDFAENSAIFELNTSTIYDKLYYISNHTNNDYRNLGQKRLKLS